MLLPITHHLLAYSAPSSASKHRHVPYQNKDTAKNTIKVLLDKSFKTHKHLLRDKVIAPRTLKCTNYNGKLMLMGVAEVRKV